MLLLPSIFLYGTVELWFRHQHPYDLTGFWWEAGDKGAIRMSLHSAIEEWAFTPEWTFEQVEGYLNELELPRPHER